MIPAGPATTGLEPYEALAQVYDQWTAQHDYDRWVKRIDGWLRAAGARRVLELCCGTGSVLHRLVRLGYEVIGVDRSAPMLVQARDKLGPDVPLRRATLPDVGLTPADGPVDAVLCLFDSLNYLTDPAEVAATLAAVRGVLAPGGLLVFDVNTAHRLRTVFGDSHYGDDLGAFAYVWRNRFDPADDSCQFLISLFLDDGAGVFRRHAETHRQRAYPRQWLRETAEQAGLIARAVLDDYGDDPAGPQTGRETWLLERGRR